LKISIYIQIVIQLASIHRLSICIIDLPTTDSNHDVHMYIQNKVSILLLLVLITSYSVGSSTQYGILETKSQQFSKCHKHQKIKANFPFAIKVSGMALMR
jgi:hypothetical protein